MKKQLLYPVTKKHYLLLLIFVFLFPCIAMAHPPKSLDIKYDETSQNLIVSINHKSPFVTKHYIKRVEVSVNGKTIILKEYKNQPENNPFEYTYTVPAAKGDIIDVKVSCNIFGSKKVEIQVGSTDKK